MDNVSPDESVSPRDTEADGRDRDAGAFAQSECRDPAVIAPVTTTDEATQSCFVTPAGCTDGVVRLTTWF